MNKKGASLFVAFMIGTLCFFLAYGLAAPLTSAVTSSMSSLGCTTIGINASLNYTQQATCTMIDTIAPVFIGFIFGIAGAIIGASR